MIQRLFVLLLLCALLLGCTPVGIPGIGAAPTVVPSALPTSTATATPVPSPTATPRPTATPTPTVTPRPTNTPVPITPTATLAPVGQQERQAIFEQVWALVRDRYVYTDYRGLNWQAIHDEFAPKIAAAPTPDAFYALMYQLIDRLGDQHSRFDSPQDVAAEAAEFEGDLVYVGIGAIIRNVDEGGLITRLGHGSPAEEAGLQLGDLVLKVNGIAFNDPAAFGASGPVSAVRGPAGTVVTLTVRTGSNPPRDVPVTRRPIPSSAFPPVEAQRLPGTTTGYLAINTFDLDNVDQVVRTQLESLLQSGPLSGLIIDVRTNSGGRVDFMLNTIGLFADGGTIGQSAGRTRSSPLNVPQHQALPQLQNVPIVVLTGEDTVSAAEMFAAGMQVLGRARIVGMPSAGNTENLLLHELPDGSHLWLAELAFTLPNKTLIEGSGVKPDRTVDAEWWRFPLATDPQMQAAQEELRAPQEK